MPQIRLTDQFGLDLDVAAGDLSGFAKYFATLPQLSLANFDLKSIAGLTIDNPVIKSLKAGLNFAQPVDIGSGGVALKIGAGVGGSIDIFVPPAGGSPLFNPDPYAEPIPVGASERYVSITLSGNAGPDIQVPANQLKLGFAAGVAVSLSNYRRFATQP